MCFHCIVYYLWTICELYCIQHWNCLHTYFFGMLEQPIDPHYCLNLLSWHAGPTHRSTLLFKLTFLAFWTSPSTQLLFKLTFLACWTNWSIKLLFKLTFLACWTNPSIITFPTFSCFCVTCFKLFTMAFINTIVSISTCGTCWKTCNTLN